MTVPQLETMKLNIQISKNGRIEKTVQLDPGEYTVGRGETCDIILEDPSVSKNHAGLKVLSEKVTIRDVESGIRTNIETRIRDGGGYFNFQKDTVNLRLKLVRVHTEYLSVLGPNEFFACVDLATENGDVYDVDFFMSGTANDMRVTRTDVHKLNGKPYYTWKQAQDKTWFTVPVQNASNDLLGVVEGTDHFTFTYEARLPVLSGPATMWIPVARSDPFQTIEIMSLQAPGKQQMIQEDEYQNRILYLQFHARIFPVTFSCQMSIVISTEREESKLNTVFLVFCFHLVKLLSQFS